MTNKISNILTRRIEKFESLAKKPKDKHNQIDFAVDGVYIVETMPTIF